jgi:hypothetical protein
MDLHHKIEPDQSTNFALYCIVFIRYLKAALSVMFLKRRGTRKGILGAILFILNSTLFSISAYDLLLPTINLLCLNPT